MGSNSKEIYATTPEVIINATISNNENLNSYHIYQFGLVQNIGPFGLGIMEHSIPSIDINNPIINSFDFLNFKLEANFKHHTNNGIYHFVINRFEVLFKINPS